MKKNIFNIFTLLVMALVGLSLAACSEDNLDTNQYQDGVSLNVFGPSPVMRGGQLRFIGSNLDQVSQILIPGCDAITSFDVIKSGTPSEIKVTVPKDGPTVGKVTLVTKTDQRITTKSDLTYTESIEFTAFSPTTVMPGEELTITGDYLNLVHSVGFADNVIVSENDSLFKEHTRYKIVVVVPNNARTGKVSLYDADLADPSFDASTATYNTIESESVLAIGTPYVTNMESPRGKAGLLGTVTAKQYETITLTGEYLNLIESIKTGDTDGVLGEYEFKDFTVSADGKTLTFTLPAEAPDGDINLVCISGVEVPVGKLVTVVPTDLKASPNPVKNGQELTITGNDLDVIISVTFPNSEAIAVSPTEHELKVIVPESAEENDIMMTMKNGKTVNVPYTLVKPVVTIYSANPVSAGGALTITGTNLDLVKTITFNGSETPVEVAAEQNGTVINLTVPMDAKSGAVTLNLKNGTDIVAPEISVTEAVFCYATALPTEDDEIHAGETMTLTVKNIDKLTGVTMNGTTCQYITSGDKLIIGVPENAKKSSKLKLISSNGEIEYTVAIIPNTEITTVLWSGIATADDWANQPYVLSDAGKELIDADVEVGDEISFHISPMEANWKLQIVEGHWGATYASICNVGNDTESGKFTEYDLDKNKGWFTMTVTQEMLTAALTQQWWGGVFVLNGDNVVVDKITAIKHISLETTVWQGSTTLSWSAGGRVCVPATAFEDVKAGAKLRFYYENYDCSAWGCFQINDGAWKGINFTEGANIFDQQYCPNDTYGWSGIVESAVLEVTLTQAILDQILKNRGDDGDDNQTDCGLIVQGSGPKVTKVTIE